MLQQSNCNGAHVNCRSALHTPIPNPTPYGNQKVVTRTKMSGSSQSKIVPQATVKVIKMKKIKVPNKVRLKKDLNSGAGWRMVSSKQADHYNGFKGFRNGGHVDCRSALHILIPGAQTFCTNKTFIPLSHSLNSAIPAIVSKYQEPRNA